MPIKAHPNFFYDFRLICRGEFVLLLVGRNEQLKKNCHLSGCDEIVAAISSSNWSFSLSQYLLPNGKSLTGRANNTFYEAL